MHIKCLTTIGYAIRDKGGDVGRGWISCSNQWGFKLKVGLFALNMKLEYNIWHACERDDPSKNLSHSFSNDWKSVWWVGWSGGEKGGSKGNGRWEI